jgi:organic hydroperoxide reductase OsmC/OhrA
MHTYSAEITWEDEDDSFSTGKYSRAHRWTFDGGITVPASSSPQVVRLPYSREDAVDPEEAFVAAVSSCHMLTLLFIIHQKGFVVKRYRDQAAGFMEKGADGREWISRIELNPQILFEGRAPSAAELKELHEKAHHECYISNSIKTSVEVKS